MALRQIEKEFAFFFEALLQFQQDLRTAHRLGPLYNKNSQSLVLMMKDIQIWERFLTPLVPEDDTNDLLLVKRNLLRIIDRLINLDPTTGLDAWLQRNIQIYESRARSVQTLPYDLTQKRQEPALTRAAEIKVTTAQLPVVFNPKAQPDADHLKTSFDSLLARIAGLKIEYLGADASYPLSLEVNQDFGQGCLTYTQIYRGLTDVVSDFTKLLRMQSAKLYLSPNRDPKSQQSKPAVERPDTWTRLFNRVGLSKEDQQPLLAILFSRQNPVTGVPGLFAFRDGVRIRLQRYEELKTHWDLLTSAREIESLKQRKGAVINEYEAYQQKLAALQDEMTKIDEEIVAQTHLWEMKQQALVERQNVGIGSRSIPSRSRISGPM